MVIIVIFCDFGGFIIRCEGFLDWKFYCGNFVVGVNVNVVKDVMIVLSIVLGF